MVTSSDICEDDISSLIIETYTKGARNLNGCALLTYTKYYRRFAGSFFPNDTENKIGLSLTYSHSHIILYTINSQPAKYNRLMFNGAFRACRDIMDPMALGPTRIW